MSTTAKLALLEEYARIAQALAAPARLQILEALAQTERGVDALAARTGLSVANCSQHLQNLRRAGLVTARREGKQVIYALSDLVVLDLMAGLRRLAERNRTQVRDILAAIADGEHGAEPMGRDELERRLQEGTVTVLDVRPEDEFVLGHLPKAVHLPPAAIPDAPAFVQEGRDVVAYCRGPYCLYAEEAVAALRRAGRKARVLEGGWPEWRAEGRAVSRSR